MNLGWFSALAAASGLHVLAVEPRQAPLRRLCLTRSFWGLWVGVWEGGGCGGRTQGFWGKVLSLNHRTLQMKSRPKQNVSRKSCSCIQVHEEDHRPEPGLAKSGLCSRRDTQRRYEQTALSARSLLGLLLSSSNTC